MENLFDNDQKNMDLPPGFRFHPTDEELISQYLYKKVLGFNFFDRVIGDVDLNKFEPWDLPWKAKMGEKEWYFFCVKDRKYPTGSRTNRATEAGYWKATGKDKEIFRGKSLIGMKKTLVFYKGRAPKGVKTNWVMHEYRLDGKFSVHNLLKSAKNEWVICRVFHKSSNGKKVHISELVKFPSHGLPPLTDPRPPYVSDIKPVTDSAYVPCFSNNPIDSFNNQILSASLNNQDGFSMIPVSSPFVSQATGVAADLSSAMCCVVSNFGIGKTQFGDHTTATVAAGSSGGVGPVDLDCLWSY